MYGAICAYALCLLLLDMSSVISVTGTEIHEEHATLIDPFTEILEVYNASTMDAGLLQRLVDELGTKFHCDGGEGANNGCTSALCLNATQMAEELGADPTAVSEEHFTEISVALVHFLSSTNITCGQNVVISAADAQTAKTQLVSQFCECTTTNRSGGLKINAIQQFLELLSLESGHDHSNDHADDHADEHTDDHADEHTDENTDNHLDDHVDDHAGASEHDEHAGEEGHQASIEEKCLGADILLDQLGLDVRGHIDVSETGHLARLIVLHILKDSRVSRRCRLLPRPGFFTEAMFEKFGSSDVMSKQGFVEIMEALKIGGTTHDESETAHVDEHDHKRKKRDADDLFENHAWETTCYTPDQYYSIFDVDAEITREKFNEMCGALIQQKVGGACDAADEHMSEAAKGPSVAERYGFGSLCTALICLCSVFAVFFLRCQNTSAYRHMMDFLIGLAVGTLFTDAMFHLLPMAFGLHGHEGDDHAHGDGDAIVVEPFVWHALSACGGLYAFYLLEKALSFIGPKLGHTHGDSPSDTYTPTSITEHQIKVDSNVHSPDEINLSFGEEAGSQTKFFEPFGNTGVSGVVVMVILGDAIHNFADGLALGAAFSSSNSLGFSTAIAVFCHELPHELGDFAVMITGGLTFGRALMWNLLSSLTAMLGLYIGLAVSTDEAVRQWIVGVTAGLFLYISLVDLLPQLLKRREKGSVTAFVLNNIGIFLGALAMFLLAIFEEKITFD